jgi:outer membrane protein
MMESEALRDKVFRGACWRRRLAAWVLLLLIPAMLRSGPADAQSKAPAPASAALTLPEAVRIALEKNPSVLAARAESQAADQSVTISRAERYPRLDFSEGFTRGNNPVYVFGSLLTQRQFTAGNFSLGLLNVPPPLDNFRTQFTGTMPIYDFGRTSRRVHGAKLEAQGVEQAGHRTRQETIFAVVQAYFTELLAQADVAVAQTTVDQAQADLARAQSREEQGLAVHSDVLSAQVQVAQTQEGLLRAQNAVEVSQAALNVAMGLPEDAPTGVAGRLSETAFDVGTLAERQSRALALRPDYHQAELGAQRARNGLGTARAEFLPKLDLFSSWEADNQTFAARGGNNWALGATLKFNLFDGGANRARLAQSKALERRAEALKSQTASGVRLEVREAYLNLETARRRVEVTRGAIAQSEESLRIIQNRYEAGLATISDLLRAEAERAAVHQNYLNALFDYRLGYAALELATGELAADSPAVTR